MPWIISTTLTIFVPLVLVYWYVGRKLSKALTRLFQFNPARVRALITVVAILVNLLPPVFLGSFLTWGRSGTIAFSGENRIIDLLLVYPFWIALVIVVQLFLIFVVIDLLRLALYPVYRRTRDSWTEWKSRIIVVALMLVTMYSLIAVYLDTWTIRTRVETIPIPESAQALRGLRIAHISDIQRDGRTTAAKLSECMRIVNELKPDIVFFAGDLITSGEKYITSSAQAFSELEAPLGVYAAVGDHDIFSNKRMVVQSLTENGVHVIEDSTVSILVNGERVSITGITYTYRQKPNGDSLYILTNGHDSAFKILVVHQPARSLVPIAAESEYDLVLAGHTHGGGIAFGFPSLFLVAPASFKTPYVSGLFKVKSTYINVTNGVGFTLAPIRFHAPAEISLLIFE